MRILYVFPHPDDESFGPARAMAWQRRHGHEVYLLTLTRGGATRQRFKYGYSVEEMGRVRHDEMQEVARVLGLTGLTVLDLPDSGLKEMDPRAIEAVVTGELERLRPELVVTYPVRGISGFHDHLVTHAVVKRAWLEANPRIPQLQRLAFFTLPEEQARQATLFHLSGSTPDEIDSVLTVDPVDIEANHRALDCYVTFQETIENSGVKKTLTPEVCFEIFQERHDPPLPDPLENLP